VAPGALPSRVAGGRRFCWRSPSPSTTPRRGATRRLECLVLAGGRRASWRALRKATLRAPARVAEDRYGRPAGVASESALNGSVIRRPPPSFPLHCLSFRNTARVPWRRGPDRASQVPGQPSACVSQLSSTPSPSSCLASRTTPSGRVAVDRAQMVPHSVSRSLVSLPSQRVDASLAPLPAQQLSARARLTSRLVANLCRFQGAPTRFQSIHLH
jgi:hypothetical protein